MERRRLPDPPPRVRVYKRRISAPPDRRSRKEDEDDDDDDDGRRTREGKVRLGKVRLS